MAVRQILQLMYQTKVIVQTTAACSQCYCLTRSQLLCALYTAHNPYGSTHQGLCSNVPAATSGSLPTTSGYSQQCSRATYAQHHHNHTRIIRWQTLRLTCPESRTTVLICTHITKANLNTTRPNLSAACTHTCPLSLHCRHIHSACHNTNNRIASTVHPVTTHVFSYQSHSTA